MIKTNLKYMISLIIGAAIAILAHSGSYAITFSAIPATPNIDTQISLSWSTVGGARIYKITRTDGIAPVATVVYADVNTSLNYTSYTDTGLKPETQYNYTVTAYQDAAMSVPLESNTANPSTGIMPSPANITWKFDINSHAITLSWANGSLAAAGTEIRLGASNGQKVAEINTSGTTVTFNDSVTPTGADRDYYLVTKDANGHFSPAAGPIRVKPVEPPNITSIGFVSDTRVLIWDTYPDIDKFVVEKSKWDGTSWTPWTITSYAPSGTQYDIWTITSGIYRFRLTAKAGSNYIGSSNISDSVLKPGRPVNVSCSIVNSNSISITWQIDPDNNADLLIERAIDSNSYRSLATLDKSVTSYTDNTALNIGSTYSYRIVEYDAANVAYVSDVASLTAAVPAAPTALNLTLASGSKVVLQWTDNSNNETGFEVERKTNTGVYTTITGTTPLPSGTVTYDDNSVISGNTYTYRVRAKNVLGYSGYSPEVSTVVAETAVPAALTVIPASSTQIDLAWTYSGGGSYSTIIERKTGTDGAWSTIRTTTTGTVKYSDYGLTPNTQYFYRVRNSFGSGAASVPFPSDNGKGAYTMLPSLSLSGSASSGGSISLSWSGNSANAEVVVERKMASGSFSSVAVVGSSDTGWTDTSGLVPGASYTYRVKARSGSNESAYSSEVTVVNYYLLAPSSLSAMANTNNAIELSWIDNSNDESGFEIWRYVYGTGTYSLYATVGKNTVKYTDSIVQTGVQYYYMVRAYSSDNSLYSSYSNSASVGIGLVNPPTNLHWSYISANQLKLMWDDNSSDENGFKLEWKTGEDGTWSVYALLAANTTSYTVSGLNEYNRYFFRVRAYKYSKNADSMSNEIEVSTAIPAAPSDVKAAAASSTQVNISWKDNSDDETGFRILRRTTNQGYFSTIAELGPGATSYVDKGVFAGIKYFYKVVAYNLIGADESPETSTVTMNNVTFTDVTPNISWARDAIENLAGRGIIKGKTDKLFKPNDTITKAEFTSLMLRAFGLSTVPTGSLADVKLGKWYYSDVMTAENLGIISGDTSGRFYPDRAITREEIAVILYKTLDAAGKTLPGHDNSVLEKFSDKNLVTPSNISYIASLIGEGVMEGISGAIAPRKTATRAQAAVFIYRVIDR